MRHMVLLVLVGLVGGCGEQRPVMSHGKPVGHWVEALRDPNAKVRKQAVTALGHVGTADPAALPAVIEAVNDRDARVRAEAVLRLLNLGPAARDAIPALEQACRDRDPTVRAYAARALERVRLQE
jgi:HEAT repeat protein